jgi:hypothetical protein
MDWAIEDKGTKDKGIGRFEHNFILDNQLDWR